MSRARPPAGAAGGWYRRRVTLRIGVLGAARIAPGALIEPAAALDGVEVTAIAARDPARAETFATEHGIPTVLPDYGALCRSDRVDAVYVALPASHHHHWSIEALRAGKHVLCEKPIAGNAIEAAEMVTVAGESGRLLVEAFHWRYHPLADRMKALFDTRLGTIRRVEAEFSVPIPDRSNIRYQLELGGGALMDLGCYPIQWVRFLLRGEPTVVEASATEEPAGVDQSLRARLRFDAHGGVLADVACSMADDAERRAVVVAEGSEGTLTVTNPLAPHHGNRIELSTAAGTEVEEIRSASTYHHQLVAFADAVRTGTAPVTSGADSIANMATIDACYRAAGLRPRGAGGEKPGPV